jgi:hypothetical protein
MRTGNFTQDVPESSNARAGAATNELCNVAHGILPPPPPPPLPVSLEQLLAKKKELMRVLTENLVQHEVRLPHSQPGMETSYTDFLGCTLRHLPRQLIRWRHITGFTSSSPSLGFYTTLRSGGPYLWPSNFMDPRVLGWLTSSPPFRTAARCHGPNSAWLFVGTTSLQV